ncbi:MAG TPA: UDP-N-acetylmuramoyl-L-alanine--D-glutamate ligase [Acetobacteraceae bacterium]|nr:UDP-N-acetylmuramoyl-L-alanine--D-glutamate ligase [Acetobacteraceae bacterium]
MNGFPRSLFAGARFAIVGLGRNGLPAARALAGMGAEVIAWDDQPAAREAAAQEGFTVREPTMAGLDALILSPGIPHRLPRPHRLAQTAAEAGVPILSDADLLYQAVRRAGSGARFAGITGTNGKSTTTALLAHILTTAGIPNAAGGNLGPAALALPLLHQDGVYVLEMSSYMLERLAALRFDAAAMLNLSADHIDRHGDMRGYARAKRAIFDRQRAEDTAIIGIDDADSRALAATLGRPVIRISGEQPADVSGGQPADVYCADGILRDRTGKLLAMAEARALPGAHNAQNAAAAAALATALGVKREAIAAGIASFPGLAHRQQLVAATGGIRFINDSKATNADAAARALACHDRLIWIAGGVAKEGGIASLAAYFPRIAHTLLIGRDAPLLAETLAAHGAPFTIVETLECAVPAALAAARQGGADVVLLSPACASFDQFSGFEARGDRFAALAAALAPNAAPQAALTREAP